LVPWPEVWVFHWAGNCAISPFAGSPLISAEFQDASVSQHIARATVPDDDFKWIASLSTSVGVTLAPSEMRGPDSCINRKRLNFQDFLYLRPIHEVMNVK